MSTITQHALGTPCWFDLATSDAVAARAFYGALFGWSFDISGPEYGHYSTGLIGGKKAAALGQIPPGQPYPVAWTVYFASADANRTATAISEAGGTIRAGPMTIGEHGRMLAAANPAGAAFGVWQPLEHRGAELVNEPGTMAWCEVNTPDAFAASNFYGRVFGLIAKKMEGDALPTAYYTLHVASDKDAACGVLQMNERWAGVPPHWMVYFVVADLERSLTTVRELGGKVAVPPFDTPYGRLSVINDPQGAVLTLLQRPADGAPATA